MSLYVQSSVVTDSCLISNLIGKLIEFSDSTRELNFKYLKKRENEF